METSQICKIPDKKYHFQRQISKILIISNQNPKTASGLVKNGTRKSRYISQQWLQG